MCGIAGFVDLHGHLQSSDVGPVATAMSDAIASRGPDDSGIWKEAGPHIALAHRRLSIIDLSPAGHQPMQSACGRFVLAYNGEVYNFAELRVDLERSGTRFRGDSDTEVILEGIASWGLAATIERFIGMFAFALWDRKERVMHLVRDRLGIKPLYWGFAGRSLIFASELKALHAYPGWHPKLNRNAVATYLRHNYVPSPHSIYEGIHKLEPGTRLTFDTTGSCQITRFWDLDRIACEGTQHRQARCAESLLKETEVLLRDAVRKRMVADVPLGALLSGGIDSSLVTALMQAQSDRPVRTFSIGFGEREFDEAPFAARIAEHLGTEHTELYVEPTQALDVVPRIPEIYDEPFGDSSQIPTFLVCELTRRHVTVVLSGDGGDELFAGYNRYTLGASIWSRMERVPGWVRKGAGRSLLALPESLINLASGLARSDGPQGNLGARVHKLGRSLLRPDADAMYRQILSHWTEPDDLVLGGSETRGILWDASIADRIPDLIERMQFFDTLTYLPDDILTKVDRASMAVGLEARVPLLDHRVVEQSWRLPAALKSAGGTSKILLRRILENYVPRELFERPKQGFGVPLESWLRGPLRDWAESLLDEKRMREQGLLDPKLIQSRWRAHLNGANWAYPIWDVLMLQAWLERYRW